MNQVLFYSQNEEKKKQVMKLAEDCRFSYAEISPSDFDVEIGALVFRPEPFYVLDFSRCVGIPYVNNAKMPALYEMPELLVLSDLSSAQLDLFLKMMKESGIAVTLKASFTNQNALWTPYTLSLHLKQEHEMMEKFLRERNQ